MLIGGFVLGGLYENDDVIPDLKIDVGIRGHPHIPPDVLRDGYLTFGSDFHGNTVSCITNGASSFIA